MRTAFSVQIHDPQAVSVEDVISSENDLFDPYPNPATNQLFIEVHRLAMAVLLRLDTPLGADRPKIVKEKYPFLGDNLAIKEKTASTARRGGLWRRRESKGYLVVGPEGQGVRVGSGFVATWRLFLATGVLDLDLGELLRKMGVAGVLWKILLEGTIRISSKE